MKSLGKYEKGTPEYYAYCEGWGEGLEFARECDERQCRQEEGHEKATATRRKRAAIAAGLVVDLDVLRARRAARKTGAS